MKLEQSFEVAAPIDQVWAALIDLERVAPCLPGAAITEHDDEGNYHGTFQVKLGPTTAAYRGTIRIESADESTHTGDAQGARDRQARPGRRVGDDRQHAHGARGRHARRTPTTDFTITGRLARFGRGGMIEDISNRLLRDFSTCLQSRLADAPEAAAAPSGADVSAGDAPPEAVGAAAGEGGQMDAEAAAASAGATRRGRPPGRPPAGAAAAAAPAQPQAAKPVGGFGLFFSVLWERIRRRFGRSRGPR